MVYELVRIRGEFEFERIRANSNLHPYAVAPNSPCRVSNPDVVSECGLSELTSSIHSGDETEHDAFFVQTCVKEVENADYAAPLKPPGRGVGPPIQAKRVRGLQEEIGGKNAMLR